MEIPEISLRESFQQSYEDLCSIGRGESQNSLSDDRPDDDPTRSLRSILPPRMMGEQMPIGSKTELIVLKTPLLV